LWNYLSVPTIGKEGEMKNSSASVKRVLVMEDEPSISQVCLRALTSEEEFEVDIAVNGAIARDMLGEKEYDLCLIDIRTPVMNGKQLYQWVSEKHPELISGVIFTTGDLISRDTKSFLDRVGRPFLPKPFTIDELKTIVRETLGQMEK